MSYLKQLELHQALQKSQLAGTVEEISFTELKLARLNMDLTTLKTAIEITDEMIAEEKEFAPQRPVVKDTEGQVGAGC